MNFKEKYEYLEKGIWHICDRKIWELLPDKPGFEQIINRQTNVYSDGDYYQWSYSGHEKHNLAGPAYVAKRKNKIIKLEWVVHGRWLKEFEKYFSKKTPKKSVFKYLQDYPQFIKEIALLAKYNNWLTEKELLLLQTIDLFA